MTRSQPHQPGEASPDEPRSGAGLLRPVVLLLAGTIAYATSFAGVFLFDDIPAIVNEPVIRDWSLLFDMLATRRPIVTLTFAINYSFGGLEPAGYHVVNLTIHLLAALVLYGVVRRTLELPRIAPAIARRARDIAFFGALLWVVHPLTSQSVTYIVQRAESMMGLFYLLTLYCVIRGATGREGAGWYALGVLACAAGMGSKGVMVTAPIAVLLYDRLFLGSSVLEALRRRAGLYVALGATWGVLYFAGIVTAVLPSGPGTRVPATVGFKTPGVDPLEYLFTQGGVLLHYLRLGVLPTGQNLDPEWPMADGLTPGVAIPGLVVLVLLGATLWGTVRRRPWSYLGAWFFVILAPTSSFIPIRDAAYEHRMYLPLASITVGASVLGALLVQRLGRGSVSRERTIRRAVVVGAFLACVALAAATLQRNTVYASRLDMWQDVIEKNPDALRARINAGQALNQQRRFDEALPLLEEATRINPSYPDAYVELGFAYAGLDRPDEARRAFDRALDLGLLGGAGIYGKFAGRANREGFPDVAERAFARAHELQPSNVLWTYWLGASIAAQGRYQQAIPLLEEARAANESFAPTYWTLGLSYEMTGNADAGAAMYVRSIELAPDTLEAYVQLANYHTTKAEYAQAAEILEQMLAREIPPERQPTARIGWFNLGNAKFSLGRYNEAVECYDRALEIQPDHLPSIIGKARAFFQLNLFDESLEVLRDAREMAPNSPEVISLYRQISIERRRMMLGPSEEELENATKR